MRGLLTLVAVAALMVAFLYWKLSGDPGEVLAAGQGADDPNRGRVVVGLEAPAAAEPAPSEPVGPAAAFGEHGDEAAEAGPGAAAVAAERPAPPPPPAAVVAPPRHTVQAGDTLYSIVRRAYGVANAELVEAVAAANRLEDASSLEIGQVLVLPLIDGYSAPEPPGTGSSGR